MAKMHRLKWTSITVGTVLAALIGVASAEAADCPRKDALGTSRVLSVDAKTTPRVGLKSFPQTLPLASVVKVPHDLLLAVDGDAAAGERLEVNADTAAFVKKVGSGVDDAFLGAVLERIDQPGNMIDDLLSPFEGSGVG